MLYVYTLRCGDGSYYVGHTDNLEARLASHRDGTFKGYTSRHLPVRLMWQQTFASRDEAFAAERRSKAGRALRKKP